MSASHIFLPSKQGNREEFLSSGTFNVPEGVTHVTVLGCGGGQGGQNGGDKRGGNGAGLVVGSVSVTPGSSVSVTVGGGGAPGLGVGGNSSFGSFVMKGAGNLLAVVRSGYTTGGDPNGGSFGALAQGNGRFDGGSNNGTDSGGGGAGAFGNGANFGQTAGNNTGAGGGASSGILPAGNGGSGRVIVVW